MNSSGFTDEHEGVRLFSGEKLGWDKLKLVLSDLRWGGGRFEPECVFACEHQHLSVLRVCSCV